MRTSKGQPNFPIAREQKGDLLKKIIILASLAVALLVVRASQAQTIQATTLTQISPAVCPPGGCAAGQSLDFRASFDLNSFSTGVSPNIQLCFFTPADWAAESWRVDTVGGITGSTYLADTTQCGPTPSGYTLLGGVSATVADGAFGDILNLGFRIHRNAVTSGSALIRVYQQSIAGWAQTDQSFSPVSVIPVTTAVFAANDASACGSFSPCYVNSGNNATGGFGTALKDAVDAQPASITILGNYQVKGSTVLINQPVTLKGLEDSRITYLGATCSEPMLKLASAVTIRDLTITDGSCSATNRDLIAVDSSQNILLEYVDLMGGLDAIKIASNTGQVTVRFSQILSNSGYAVFRVPGNPSGTLQVVGSNIFGNREGAQVDCGLAGGVDHNFWGFGKDSSTSSTQCLANDSKQLGAPVLPRDNTAGVTAEKVTVTTSKQSGFSGLISYQRSAEGNDYSLNIVNHGAGSPENVPFTGGSPGSLVACSNYYDVFLEKDAVPGGTLNLSLRFDRTTGCTATIKTASYCASPDPARFPLWWYSPWPTAPMGWNTTGSTGQTTTCDLTTSEITVAIDVTGRPDYATDLNFTPFVVGLPPAPSSVVITRLEAISGISQAAVQWATSSEINTSGFYVLRSLTVDGSFERVSPFIARKGTGVSGAAYEFVDTGLANATQYFYRLEIISTSLESSFSQVVSVIIGQPTNTATVTLTATQTMTATQTPTGSQTVTGTQTITPTGPTSTVTITPTRTSTRTITPTRIPTRTRTPIRYATYFIYRSPTAQPTRTLFPTRTATPAPTLSGGAGTATANALITQITQTSLTPDVTLTPSPETGSTGYPAPVGTEIGSLQTTNPTIDTTLAPTQPISPTLTPISTPGNLALNFGRRNWPWILGLLGFELAAIAGVSFYLYKHNLLLLAPREKDEETTEI